MLKVLALAALVQLSPPAQELAPGTRYDAAIPTLEQVAGHDFRERTVNISSEVILHFLLLDDA